MLVLRISCTDANAALIGGEPGPLTRCSSARASRVWVAAVILRASQRVQEVAAELRTKAAEQFKADVSTIVLKDVQVTYNTELVGTIRGWKATAIAGRNPAAQ
jgi:hypothetical protein